MLEWGCPGARTAERVKFSISRKALWKGLSVGVNSLQLGWEVDKDHFVSPCKFSLRITYHFIAGEFGDGL